MEKEDLPGLDGENVSPGEKHPQRLWIIFRRPFPRKRASKIMYIDPQRGVYTAGAQIEIYCTEKVWEILRFVVVFFFFSAKV